MLSKDGIPTVDDLAAVTPGDERFNKGPVVIVECFQQIPCDPCVTVCKPGAITKPGGINDLPKVDFDKCNGCGVCISKCPGLAIFVVDKTYSRTHAAVRMPYEFLPLPKTGQMVSALDRAGNVQGSFEVIRTAVSDNKNKTATVWLAVPQELAMEIRSVKV